MTPGLKWIVAACMMCAGALVAGCPEETGTSEAARSAPLKARDYLFPSSEKATYTYLQTTTTWSSGQAEPDVSTASLKIKTTLLKDHEAVFVADLLDLPVLGTLPIATVSLTAASDGTITDSTTTLLGHDTPVSYPDAVLTSKGATIRPASGSVPALGMARLAKETITVPAGNFETLKMNQTEGGETIRSIWLAKGMGLWGVKQTATSTQSWSDDTTSTTSTEVVLKSFTP